MIEVNAVGDACPIPVVKTKDAIKTLGSAGGQVRTIVDNEIAVQNLQKMAAQKQWEIVSDKRADGNYEVVITVLGGQENPAEGVAETCTTAQPQTAGTRRIAVVFDTDTVGEGVAALGRILMKSFALALTKQDTLPAIIICYNGGAYLTCEGSEILEDLQTLADAGTQICTCGTCLDYYGLRDKLKVGTVSNMYEIAEMLLTADSVVHP